MALALGSDLIEFALPAVDGNTYSTKDFSQKKALAVVFSCNHCPYVLAWEDRLIQAQHDYDEHGVQFLFICSNDAEKYPADNFENMLSHAKQKAFPFPYLHDESQDIAKAYGAERTPEIFLFDDKRQLVYHGAPDDNYEEAEAVSATYLRDAIDAILAGESPATPSTPPKGCTIKWK